MASQFADLIPSASPGAPGAPDAFKDLTPQSAGGSVKSFIDNAGRHIGIPGTNLDLDHAAKAITGGINSLTGSSFDTGTDASDAAENAAHPVASNLGALTGAGIGLTAGGAALGTLKNAVSYGWEARKAAILAEQAAKINAAQDAAHIQQIAEAVAPRSWAQVGQKINAFLKDDAAAEAQLGKTSGEGGAPQWSTGQPPRAPVDVTPADLARQAAEAAAGKSTRSILKNPAFWYAITGAGALGGGGVWSAMSTTYHARQLVRNLSRIFGE